jgi:hypothetical protein
MIMSIREDDLTSPMCFALEITSAEAFRQKAVDLCSQANGQTSHSIRVDLQNWAFHYMALADRADRAAGSDRYSAACDLAG